MLDLQLCPIRDIILNLYDASCITTRLHYLYGVVRVEDNQKGGLVMDGNGEAG